jgi:hypothetical protein
MPADQSRYVPVNTSLLLQTLVEAVHEQMLERRAAGALLALPRALYASDRPLAGDNEPALDRDLRLAGYIARLVEVDLFEPAQGVAPWAPAMLEELYAESGDWTQAVVTACSELAFKEPVEKPDPDDPDAMSWHVPGPGGHVRHYLARRTIDEFLRPREEPIEGDPADLKRPWMYGFFVRTCEEALPDGVTLAGDRD